jgi:hypothetical protein
VGILKIMERHVSFTGKSERPSLGIASRIALGDSGWIRDSLGSEDNEDIQHRPKHVGEDNLLIRVSLLCAVPIAVNTLHLLENC